MATAVRAADGDPSDQARRDQLNTERAAAQARYDQTVRECERAFAVTDCVNQAKAERRTALDRMSREQAALDDAERKRRAEERRQRIAKKQAQQAQQSPRPVDTRGAASAPLQVRAPRQASSAASAVAKPARRAEPRTPGAAAAAEAEAAERAALSQQRRERAQAHEEAVRKRNAERAAQRAPAAPLPVPQASGAASAIR